MNTLQFGKLLKSQLREFVFPCSCFCVDLWPCLMQTGPEWAATFNDADRNHRSAYRGADHTSDNDDFLQCLYSPTQHHHFARVGHLLAGRPGARSHTGRQHICGECTRERERRLWPFIRRLIDAEQNKTAVMYRHHFFSRNRYRYLYISIHTQLYTQYSVQCY